MIYKSKLLNDNGVIIIHRHKKEEDEFPKEFNLIIKKNYGISKIISPVISKLIFFLFLFLLIQLR